MIRTTVFASLIAFGAVAGVAQAQENAPRLVNQNGSQEVVNEQAGDNIVGGAFATITGGANFQTYSAAPGARTGRQDDLVATLSGGGDNEVITYAAPTGTDSSAYALRLRPSHGG